MPRAKPKPKPAAPVAPAPPPVPEPTPQPPPNLPVLYDRVEIDEYSTTSTKGPLDAEWCAAALGWETEPEYQARMVREKGGKPEHYVFGDLGIRHEDGSVTPVHCKDVGSKGMWTGHKVVTKFNAQNRPFDQSWCESLIHTILHGQWAGPFTLPGETINGETVRISRYGRVISAQHQMTACKLADEFLQKARAELGREAADAKYPVWADQDHCFIETVVVKGMSEDPRVLMTVDYVKPRTAADVFYTSAVFKQSTPPERKELCRILAGATDMLWTRTAARGYRTHPEIVGFLERHRWLLDCVLHIFAENGEARRISKLRLSTGHAAALMYLMATGATSPEDSDVYRNMEPAPCEDKLDWSLRDRAEQFWTLLAGGKDFIIVRQALALLVDSTPDSEENQGQGGRAPEKLAILAKAWERWKDHPTNAGPPFSADDLGPEGCLTLSYGDLDDKGDALPEGQVKLLDVADFLGIDCPSVIDKSKGATRHAPPEPPPPSEKEIWGDRDGPGATDRLRAEAAARRAQKK